MSSTASPDESAVAVSYRDDDDSSWLTKGEIVFVTLLAFVVLLALILGIYTVCTRREEGATTPESEAQHRSADGQRAAFVVDIEVTETPPDGEHGKLLAPSPPPPRTKGHHSAAEVGAPHVSNRYKRAAIDHMNQISQAGRH